MTYRVFRTPSPLNNVITIDDERIKNHLDRVVRGSVEETLNALLEAEAGRLCNAQRYERSEARRPISARMASSSSSSCRSRGRKAWASYSCHSSSSDGPRRRLSVGLVAIVSAASVTLRVRAISTAVLMASSRLSV